MIILVVLAKQENEVYQVKKGTKAILELDLRDCLPKN